ncbi:MAG: cell division protein ZapA [Paludibacter sp.]|jgi:hypothetical protein|nr:cell division protein ZapA [Paludibacter sp.]
MNNIEDKFEITVPISEWQLRLKINRADELMYRDAQKVLNQNLAKSFNNNPKKSREECLMMLAYQFAIELVKEKYRQDDSVLTSKIKELSSEIDNLLAE